MPERQIGTATIHYEEGGSGDPPLVLVHGFPLDGRVFERQLEGLARATRVIVPDLPGFGRSTAETGAAGDFTIATLADGLRSFLQQVDALPCVLGGLSMGGYVALAFARKYAADLRGLVLIDTRAEADAPEARANRDRMIEIARSRGAQAIAEQMLPKMLAEATAHARPNIVARLRQVMESQPVETICRALAAMRDREDHAAALASIAVPTLIVVGQYDAITPPALAEQMHAALPVSWLTTIDNSGHMAPMEQPELLNRAISRFIDEIKRSQKR